MWSKDAEPTGEVKHSAGEYIYEERVYTIMVKRRPLVPIKFTVSVALSTLADGAVITVPTVVPVQDFDIITTHMTISVHDLTVGEGPIDVGLSAGIYTTAEIAEAIDAKPLSQYGTEMERSRRQVRLYGTFAAGVAANDVLNDGEPIKKKMFLRASAGSVLADCWVRNNTGATLTTGAEVHFTGVHWGRWK